MPQVSETTKPPNLSGITGHDLQLSSCSQVDLATSRDGEIPAEPSLDTTGASPSRIATEIREPLQIAHSPAELAQSRSSGMLRFKDGNQVPLDRRAQDIEGQMAEPYGIHVVLLEV